MQAATVNRLISLIPDRAVRVQSGSVFSPSEAAACRFPERMSYLSKFLTWLGPLDPMTKEDQQILGVRTSGGRPGMAEEELELDDLEAEEEPIGMVEAGTQIAPTLPPSTVGGSHA